MKHNTILRLSAFLTVLAVIGNSVLTVLFTVRSNGFMKSGSEMIWYAIMGVSSLFGVLIFVMCLRSYRRPNDFIYQSRLLALLSLAVSASSLLRAFEAFRNGLSTMNLVYSLATVLFAASFLIKSISFLNNYEIPKPVHVYPCLYFVFDMLWLFIKYSGIKPVPYTILLFSATAMSMFFFLFYGKMMCDVKKPFAMKMLFPVGFLTGFLCLLTGVTNILNALLSKSGILESFLEIDYLLLAIGFFAICYVLILYRDKNIHHTIERKAADEYVITNSLYVTLVPNAVDRLHLFGKPKKKGPSKGQVFSSGFVISDQEKIEKEDLDQPDKNVEE